MTEMENLLKLIYIKKFLKEIKHDDIENIIYTDIVFSIKEKELRKKINEEITSIISKKEFIVFKKVKETARYITEKGYYYNENEQLIRIAELDYDKKKRIYL